MKFYAAPLQGLTEAPFRAALHKIYGCRAEFFGPFVRVEKGMARGRDMRDACSPLNSGLDFTPQIIVSGPEELGVLTPALKQAGHRRIDINMGCPFPPQVHHGRGAGLIAHPERLGQIASALDPDISWSLKMRPGIESADEWKALIDTINSMPLRHVCLHPRTARQQYSGEILGDTFAEFTRCCSHPVLYNGDVRTPADIDRIAATFAPAGIMIGRGLLMRPSLICEWDEGSEWPEEKRNEAFAALHSELLSHYSETLCGDSQVLMKLLPFWEYFGENLNRKAVKKIRKSRTLSAYTAAIASMQSC